MLTYPPAKTWTAKADFSNTSQRCCGCLLNVPT